MRRHLFGLSAALLVACSGGSDAESAPPAPSGSIAFEISGLPAGVPADLWAVGPSGETHRILASTSLAGLAPGDWQVGAFEVVSQGLTFAPAIAPAGVTVEDGGTADVTVAYAVPSTGSLRVNVSGLPAGTDAAIQVTAPGGYQRTVASSTTLTGLVPGPYSASVLPATVELPFVDAIYDVGSSTLPAEVFAGELAQANVSYKKRFGTGTLWVPSTAGVDLFGFDNARLAQSSGNVPMGAGLAVDGRAAAVDRGGTVWYSTASHAIVAVPLSTGNLVGAQALAPTGAPIGGILVGRQPGLWLALPTLGQLRFYQGVAPSLNPTAVATLTLAGGITQPIAIAHCGDYFWVGSDAPGGPIARLPELPLTTVTIVPSGAVSGGASFPDGVHGLACAPPGSLFATLGTAGKIIRVDFATAGLATWQEFVVGGNPSGVAVDEAGNVWFTDPTAGTVSYVAAATAAGAGATVTPIPMVTGLTLGLGFLAFDPPAIGTTLAR
jgi:hypothetical protein